MKNLLTHFIGAYLDRMSLILAGRMLLKTGWPLVMEITEIMEYSWTWYFFGHGKNNGIPKIFQKFMEKSWKIFIKINLFFFVV